MTRIGPFEATVDVIRDDALQYGSLEDSIELTLILSRTIITRHWIVLTSNQSLTVELRPSERLRPSWLLPARDLTVPTFPTLPSLDIS